MAFTIMLKPLKQFYCDTCGQLIEKPEHGWLEWLDGSTHIPEHIRIVHHKIHSPLGDCYQYYRHSNSASEHLHTALKNRMPFMLLRSKTDPKSYSPDLNVPDQRVNNFIEAARRLRIPYYEEARKYWDEALSDGFFSDMKLQTVYSESTLTQLIKKYEKLS